ncbi:MAG: putative oxidoreductase [Abditibacteriota bacterium]|jgi:putative oxidoreductase|nr:putative oxidoreductase [Abditibacteriota bacterium]
MRGSLSWMYGDFVSGRGAFGLLLLRVFAGVALMMHGWPKIQSPFSWMGSAAPGPLQAAAAISEFGGGLALALGFFTPLAALGVASTMLYAALVAHSNDPFMASNGRGKPFVPSKELAMTYLSMATLLLMIGPGRFSLDWLFFGGRRSLYTGHSKR